MVLTTTAVVGLPLLVVTMLRSEGLVAGQLQLLLVALVISFAASATGAAIWKTRPGSGDLLFGDLLIWGFVRRWRVDRRLSSAATVLGLSGGEESAGQTPAQKAQLLEKLSAALEARDPYTHGHSRRVARHSTLIAKRMGLPAKEVARIRTAAAIHDVGKVETPRDVLNKSGRLSDEEFDLIKRHPVDGARMVAALGDDELTSIVRHHHERLDGKGYPDGLRGDEIPLGARIIAVADTFDAITSTRPYRAATAHKQALEVLRTESGTQLDPKAVEAFRSYYSGLRPIALWAVLVSLPQRLFSWLFDGLGSAVASASKVTATAAIVAGSAALSVGGVAHSLGSGHASGSQGAAAAESTADARAAGQRGTHSQGQAATGAERGHGQKSNAKKHQPRHAGAGSMHAASGASPGAAPGGHAGTPAYVPASGASPSGSAGPAAQGGGAGSSGGGSAGGANQGNGGGSPTTGGPTAGSGAETPAASPTESSHQPEHPAAPEHPSPPPSASPPEHTAPEHPSPPPPPEVPEQAATPGKPASTGSAAPSPGPTASPGKAG